ncbi:Hsp20/alpha crystallin family protein [Bacillus sp. FJAT-50079]|uniref:Hsp20/alpha crystallin family protein n=1 Tax=Bacillus sp. FJAT-50079 TaxID=2833577 RepID=UPI001BCA2B32|nr:Hsp20/alpha crystallin family protein [Bacillus sp. FJAT-50079]MBS4208663.1 Hsp20/alpha crystallin family protein [Bacillus sp. FJAT-50079]
MSENLPEKHSPKEAQEQVNSLMKAMNEFFQHRPVKGFLESIDELFTTSPFGGGFPVELDENEKEYIVRAKLPGVKKDQIEIDMLPQHMTISVQHRETFVKENDKQETVQRKEMFKHYSRTIPFTKAIDARNIRAKHEDGLLTVKVPKIKGKRIDIN